MQDASISEVPHARPQRIKRNARSAPDRTSRVPAQSVLASWQAAYRFHIAAMPSRPPSTRDRPAAIDDHHRQTGFAQGVGDHRAADARADHQHIRRKIAYQQLAWDRRQPGRLPDGSAVSQPHRTRRRHCSSFVRCSVRVLCSHAGENGPAAGQERHQCLEC